jgi:hypothetical protein
MTQYAPLSPSLLYDTQAFAESQREFEAKALRPRPRFGQESASVMTAAWARPSVGSGAPRGKRTHVSAPLGPNSQGSLTQSSALSATSQHGPEASARLWFLLSPRSIVQALTGGICHPCSHLSKAAAAAGHAVCRQRVPRWPPAVTQQACLVADVGFPGQGTMRRRCSGRQSRGRSGANLGAGLLRPPPLLFPAMWGYSNTPAW